MPTNSADQILFSFNNDQVLGTYVVSMANNVSMVAGDAIVSAKITNTGPAGILHYQLFKRNSDGSQGASFLGPGTLSVHDAQIGPVDVSNQGLTMQSVATGKGTSLVPSVIAQVSWSSS